MNTPRPFYLMQRLRIDDSPRHSGFDALFSCEYMGSSEFEFGAIPQSLRAIRAYRSPVIRSMPVTHGGVTRTVYFVGGAPDVDWAMAQFPAWLENPRGQEQSYLPELLAGTARDWQQEVVAWWALRGNVMLTLDPAVAARLLLGITGGVTPAKSGKRSGRGRKS